MMAFRFLGFLIFMSSCLGKPRPDRLLVTVMRNYNIPKKTEQVTIALPWDSLITHLPALQNHAPVVTDQNFGKPVTARIVSTKNNKHPDYLVLTHTLQSDEPVFAFRVMASGKKFTVQVDEVVPDSRFTIQFLKPLATAGGHYAVATRLAQSTLNLYPDVKKFPVYAPRKWNYEYSFFMLGLYRLGKETHVPDFTIYARQWIDDFIEGSGFRPGVYTMREFKLDDVLPGRLALELYADTHHNKYKAVADTLIRQLMHQPKTSEGGYWHKEIYPHQMWLDGVFMADVFAMQYASIFNKPEWYDEAVHQIKLIYRHTYDSASGLMFHGWDESRNPVWAHPQKGTSPEFWGRAIGWYLMAIVECLDYLPAGHPERNTLIAIFQTVASGVKKYQHPQNALWYQVINKPDAPGNWVETSCSAMFTYTFAKGYRLGILDKTFLNAAERAFNALLNEYVYTDAHGNLHLDQTVKIGTLNPKTSKGDYQYYITTERRIDDYKGLAALLFASTELKK